MPVAATTTTGVVGQAEPPVTWSWISNAEDEECEEEASAAASGSVVPQRPCPPQGSSGVGDHSPTRVSTIPPSFRASLRFDNRFIVDGFWQLLHSTSKATTAGDGRLAAAGAVASRSPTVTSRADAANLDGDDSQLAAIERPTWRAAPHRPFPPGNSVLLGRNASHEQVDIAEVVMSQRSNRGTAASAIMTRSPSGIEGEGGGGGGGRRGELSHAEAVQRIPWCLRPHLARPPPSRLIRSKYLPPPPLASGVFRRLTSLDALQCLSGKHVVLIGNSNTRTLMTALQALLLNTAMLSRMAAKQLCDNSQTNHSCSVVISADDIRSRWQLPRQPPPGPTPTSRVDRDDAQMSDASSNCSSVESRKLRRLLGAPSVAGSFQAIRLDYYGYTQDGYHPSLKSKIPTHVRQRADLVIANSGLNTIQLQRDGAFESNLRLVSERLFDFALTEFTSPGRAWFWHTTTNICENQPHFRRYKYSPKYWMGRSVERVNEAVRRSNSILLAALASKQAEHESLLLQQKNPSKSANTPPPLPLGRNSTGYTLPPPPKVVIRVLDGGYLSRTGIPVPRGDSPPSLQVGMDPTSGPTTPPSVAAAGAVRSVCPYFEDPLHHRFLDRELVQLLLNNVCAPRCDNDDDDDQDPSC